MAPLLFPNRDINTLELWLLVWNRMHYEIQAGLRLKILFHPSPKVEEAPELHLQLFPLTVDTSDICDQ